jgi:hypothetical protein
MSTHDNAEYEWRETFFLFHHQSDRPATADVEKLLKELDPRFQLRDIRSNEAGRLESITILAPDAHAAIDLSYACGEDLAEQIQTLEKEMTTCDAEDRAKLQRLHDFDARLDLLHFEEVTGGDDGDFDAFLDPGALILVIQALGRLCKGVGVDPASATII